MTTSTPEVLQSMSEESTLFTRGYKLIKKLGEGSYAKVYLAEYRTPVDQQQAQQNASENNLLACKIIDTAKAPKDFVRKFLPRELDILARLNHPHVIHVHSIFQRRTKYFIFMRYAENGDVLDFVLKNGAVAESQARVWFRQVILAIQYLHELEIAHRDLKCENILITSNFNIKVADFGFAREVVDARGKRVLSDTYCGSLSYAAPEILKGSPYNPKIADVWACGVVLYIMLNKAMPFDDSNVKRLYEQQINHRWKFRAKVVDILSNQVKSLEQHILEAEVNKRWRLEQILASEWIAMDNRLLNLTQMESAAYKAATEERKRRFDGLEDRRESSKDTRQTRPTSTSLSNGLGSGKQPAKSGKPVTPEQSKDGRGLNTQVVAAAEAAAANVPEVNVIKEAKHQIQPNVSSPIPHEDRVKDD